MTLINELDDHAFSDPEDFVDDINDEGIKLNQTNCLEFQYLAFH